MAGFVAPITNQLHAWGLHIDYLYLDCACENDISTYVSMRRMAHEGISWDAVYVHMNGSNIKSTDGPQSTVTRHTCSFNSVPKSWVHCIVQLFKNVWVYLVCKRLESVHTITVCPKPSLSRVARKARQMCTVLYMYVWSAARPLTSARGVHITNSCEGENPN